MIVISNIYLVLNPILEAILNISHVLNHYPDKNPVILLLCLFCKKETSNTLHNLDKCSDKYRLFLDAF